MHIVVRLITIVVMLLFIAVAAMYGPLGRG